MPSERRLTELALAERLKDLVGTEPAKRFVGGSHTRRFADNLLPTFPAWQVDELSEQLRAGGGAELTPNANGKRRAHAPYSSAALAFNVKWGSLLEASIAGQWQPRRLGVEQLIKHVLGLRSQHPDERIHLAYVFWEPANADDHEWVRRHRAEVAELEERVSGSEIPLHAMSYSDLFQEWEALADAPHWLPEHLEALRDRYSVSVPVA